MPEKHNRSAPASATLADAIAHLKSKEPSCRRCGDRGRLVYADVDKICDGSGCDAAIRERGELTEDEIIRIRELAVTARDNPATWDDRDCPTVALWSLVSPEDLVKLCDTARSTS